MGTILKMYKNKAMLYSKSSASLCHVFFLFSNSKKIYVGDVVEEKNTTYARAPTTEKILSYDLIRMLHEWYLRGSPPVTNEIKYTTKFEYGSSSGYERSANALSYLLRLENLDPMMIIRDMVRTMRMCKDLYDLTHVNHIFNAFVAWGRMAQPNEQKKWDTLFSRWPSVEAFFLKQPSSLDEFQIGTATTSKGDDMDDDDDCDFLPKTSKSATSKKEKTMKNKLYKVTLDGKDIYCTYLATDSSSNWVMEVKGSGEYKAFAKTDLEEVMPFTVSFRNLVNNDLYHYQIENHPALLAGSLVGVKIGSQTKFCVLEGVNTKIETDSQMDIKSLMIYGFPVKADRFAQLVAAMSDMDSKVPAVNTNPVDA